MKKTEKLKFQKFIFQFSIYFLKKTEKLKFPNFPNKKIEKLKFSIFHLKILRKKLKN
jgi:hypothetical protein